MRYQNAWSNRIFTETNFGVEFRKYYIPYYTVLLFGLFVQCARRYCGGAHTFFLTYCTHIRILIESWFMICTMNPYTIHNCSTFILITKFERFRTGGAVAHTSPTYVIWSCMNLPHQCTSQQKLCVSAIFLSYLLFYDFVFKLIKQVGT